MIAIVLIAMLFPSVLSAAVNCDDPNAVGVYNAAPADPTTISYTTRSGANTVLFVGIGQRTGTTQRTHTQTHAGIALSAATTETYTDPIAGQLFYLPSPASGTNDVVVDWGSSAPLAASIVVFTCTGVDLVSPLRFGAQATGANSANPTVNVSTQTGDLVVDFMVSESIASPTVGALQTVIQSGTAGAEISAGASRQNGSDGGDMSWSTNVNDWSSHAVSLAPAIDSGGAKRRRE